MNVCSQSNMIGLQSGMSITNVFLDGNYSAKEIGINYRGGFNFTHNVNNLFNVGIDILYEQKGFKDPYVLTDEAGNNTVSAIGKFNYNYLSIPLKVGFSGGNRIQGFVNTGLVSSFLIKAGVRIPSLSTQEFNANNQDFTDEVSRLDIGVMFESGIRFKFTERVLLNISSSFQQGFISAARENQFSDKKMFHYGFMFSAGLNYVLGSK